jgi:hypothetical protein
MTSLSLHPAIDNGIQAGSKDFAGGYLYCHCDAERLLKALITMFVVAASAGNPRARCFPRLQSYPKKASA